MFEYIKSLLKLSFILSCCIQLSYAAIKSNTGTISFDSNSDSTSELTLSSTGLAIGSNLTASSNLHVSGNALISKELYIGGSSGSSNLHIHGTLGHSFATITSSGNISGNSYNLIDSSSGNIRLTLPSASTYEGRVYQFKKTSALNDVYINGGPFDDHVYLKLPSGASPLPYVSLLSCSGNWHVTGISGNSAESSSANLVGWWPFNESSGTSTTDRSSNSNTGTLNNLDFSSDGSTGILDGAITYSATDDNITASGTDFQFGTSDFSIAFWVKSSTVKRQFIASTYHGSSEESFTVELNNDGKPTFQLYGSGSTSAGGISATVITDGVWHHVVWVFNRAGNAQVYIDGSLYGVEWNISGVGSLNNARPLTIGKYPANTTLTLAGTLDDLRIYDKALSVTEVLEIYHIAKD